jgi:hypothetical protein
MLALWYRASIGNAFPFYHGTAGVCSVTSVDQRLAITRREIKQPRPMFGLLDREWKSIIRV